MATKKSEDTKKRTAAKKAVPAKKAAPAKRAAPAKKAVAPKGTAPAKSAVATKKSAPAKKAVPAKKATDKKRAAKGRAAKGSRNKSPLLSVFQGLTLGELSAVGNELFITYPDKQGASFQVSSCANGEKLVLVITLKQAGASLASANLPAAIANFLLLYADGAILADSTCCHNK